jgi:TetR/AcrR family transcriptional repressor of nem operon
MSTVRANPIYSNAESAAPHREVTMKVTQEQKTLNKEKILAAAAKLYREHGIDGIGIGELSKSVGLTHGGFYRQFPEGKEQLVCEAIDRTFDQHAELWSTAATVGEVVEQYVSHEHTDDKSGSCPIPTLGADVSRMGGAASESWTHGVKRLLDVLMTREWSDGRSISEEQAMQILASVSGAMLIAKASSDPEMIRKLLSAVVRQWQEA